MSTKDSNEAAQRLFGEKKPPTAGPWEKVGVIGVDAGLCWIGDPCYVLHKEGGAVPKTIGRNWNEFCDMILLKDATQIAYEAGHDGLGVVVSTGYGDGCYDVYVRRTPPLPGAANGRIAEVKVVFIETEE